MKDIQLSIDKKLFFRLLLLFFSIEIISFFTFSFPELRTVITVAFLIFFLIIALRNLSVALLILLAELIIGSQGYLLAVELGGFSLSLRVGMWLITMAVFFLDLLRHSSDYFKRLQNKSNRYFIGGILVLILWGVVRGLSSGNDFANLFFDTNNWFYFFLALPLLRFSKIYWHYVWQVIAAGTSWLFIKTTFLLYLFSHNFSFNQIIYKWIRDFRFGELTYVSGNFWRIFMQDQIFALLVVVFLFVYLWQKKLTFANLQKNYDLIALLLLNTITVFISYSRSFWLGGVLSLLIWFFYILIRQRLRQVQFVRLFVFGFGLSALSLSFILAVINFPLPYVQPQLANVVAERISATAGGEPAGGSRLALFGPLWQSIQSNWLLGKGLGATVTYFSRDPRIVSATAGGSGIYTTYAFEWGWLDIWLKFGWGGLLLFIYLLLKIIFKGWQKKGVEQAASVALLALIFTHLTTPYLNHPLGIGVILLTQFLVFAYED